jgi:hypothetical protein
VESVVTKISAPVIESSVQVSTGPFSPPVKRSRRGAWIALAMLMFAASALVGVVVVRQLGHRTQVLRAARDIQAGQVIAAADFEVVDVAVDGTAQLVPAADRARHVGMTAQGRIPAGSLVSPGQFQAGVGLPPGSVVVGAVLAPGALPKADLRVGDRVNLVAASQQPAPAATASTPAPSGSSAAPTTASPLIGEARVFALSRPESNSSLGAGNGAVFVSLAVREQDAARVAQVAASNSLRLIYLPEAGPK